MPFRRWNPALELADLRVQIDRIWDEFFNKISVEDPDHQKVAFLPEVDLLETDSHFRIYISIPGFVEEDLHMVVDQQSLTVQGERQPPYDPECGRCETEWRYGFFERHLKLPSPIDVDSVRATIDAGVMTIIARKLDAR